MLSLTYLLGLFAPRSSNAPYRFIHQKARQPYRNSKGEKVPRFEVPDSKVPWTVPFPDYKPVAFSDPVIEGKPWADCDIVSKSRVKLNFNQVDVKINRKSFEGRYLLDRVTGVPLNPLGRTGMRGRGLLGRWGPNHAADPIVTRWKRDEYGEQVIDSNTKRPVLQFVAICRRDTKECAIPGGMVDAGERVSQTLHREFSEEALAGFDPQARTHMADLIANFFAHGEAVYEGYVDDPRNTDNAWMETTAINFHDKNGSAVGKFPLQAGDDAGAVRWTDINKDMRLYASHTDFIRAVAEKLHAHW